MQDKPHRRRFIAGAVCPRCGLVDKIVVDLDADQRFCVSCGFKEDRPTTPGSEPSAGADNPAEMPTRVSRAAARRVETPAQPITIIDRDHDKP
ncbi:MAG TPA: YheV family putative metal-binding protein [Halioglobus sp.]